MEKIHVYNKFHKDVVEFFKKVEINSIFFSIKFIDFISKIIKLPPNFFCLYKRNKIIALIPFFEKKDIKYGKIINSLPFFGTMGGVYSINEISKKKCLRLFNKHCLSKEIFSAVLIQNYFSNIKFKLKFFFKANMEDDRVLQFINLKKDLKISRVRIRNIKKAKKLGYKVYTSNNKNLVDKLEFFHKKHMKQINGIVKPKIFFTQLKKLDPKLWKIYYSKNKSNKIIATLLVFLENQSIEYYIPACLEKYKNTQILSLLTYRSIIDAINNDYKIYNFGFTWLNQTGVYNFKKKWGCDEVNIKYLIKIRKNHLKNAKEVFKKNKYFYIAPF